MYDKNGARKTEESIGKKGNCKYGKRTKEHAQKNMRGRTKRIRFFLGHATKCIQHDVEISSRSRPRGPRQD